jgi:thiol-disulfide isomerase/thioredoxin
VTSASLIARVVLASIFAVAAAGKLMDRAGARATILAFGAPEGLATPLAVAVPVAELAAAALLLPATSAVAGAWVALGLLVAFSLAIAVNLLRGHAPECHCFGQLHSAPIGPQTLGRNAGLIVVAAVVLVGGGGPSAVAWIGRLDGTGLAMFIAGVAGVLALAAFAVLLRSYGRALVRLDRAEQALAEAGIDFEAVVGERVPEIGLPIGTPAPAFTLADVSGARVSLPDLLEPGRPVVLLFASSQCGPCAALLPRVADWQRRHADRVTIAVASDGPPDHVRAEAQELSLARVLLDEGSKLHDAFAAAGTPGGVLIDADGVVASRVAAGREEIEALLHAGLDQPGLAIGAPVPRLELATLDGDIVRLGAVSSTGAVLVFWNPDCGYCRAMHDDLLAAEGAARDGAPRLVIVSSGDTARTRDDGFRSTVLLDPNFTVGGALGAGGTPAAVRLNADGTVGSRVAVGAEAVLAMAGAGTSAKLAVVMG